MMILNEARAALGDTVLVLERCQNVTATGLNEQRFTRLRAYDGKNEVIIRVDDVVPHSMGVYLNLMCREIERCRARLIKKPGALRRTVRTVQEFVNNLAFLNMIALTDDDSGRDQKLSTNSVETG